MSCRKTEQGMVTPPAAIRILGQLRYNDGSIKFVYSDSQGQYIRASDGQRQYGHWFADERTTTSSLFNRLPFAQRFADYLEAASEESIV